MSERNAKCRYQTVAEPGYGPLRENSTKTPFPRYQTTGAFPAFHFFKTKMKISHIKNNTIKDKDRNFKSNKEHNQRCF